MPLMRRSEALVQAADCQCTRLLASEWVNGHARSSEGRPSILMPQKAQVRTFTSAEGRIPVPLPNGPMRLLLPR